MRKPAFGCFAAAALLLALSTASGPIRAQGTDALARIVQIANGYQVTANITYLTANNFESKLDIYRPRQVNSPNPTVVFFHGGGWTGGSKEGNTFTVLPYMDMGWTVVNVEYRLASVSLAPAAVEDARCALRWIYRNAKQHNIDLTKIVVTGQSAGGHLALMTGMLPSSAGFDRLCPGDRGPGPVSTEELKVAAVVNWYGITDLAELLSGPNVRSYATNWFGSMPNREELARQLSPLTYVRPGVPPIISVQGDQDPTVPYSHSVRLHEGLAKVGVPNEHVTIPGGKHGGFTDEENVKAYAAIRAFLNKQNVSRPSTNQ